MMSAAKLQARCTELMQQCPCTYSTDKYIRFLNIDITREFDYSWLKWTLA